jgi:hypothetical protein
LHKKADKEPVYSALSQMVTKSDLTETLRKYRHMYNVLEPVIENEETMGCLIAKLEQMKMLGDEQIDMLDNGIDHLE